MKSVDDLLHLIGLLRQNRNVIIVGSEGTISEDMERCTYVHSSEFKDSFKKGKYVPDADLLVFISIVWDKKFEEGLSKRGFDVDYDCIFLHHKPIVIKNVDLTETPYVDHYGNIISGNLTKCSITLRGFGSRVNVSGKLVKADIEVDCDDVVYIADSVLMGAKIVLKNSATLAFDSIYADSGLQVIVHNSNSTHIGNRTHLLKDVSILSHNNLKIGKDSVISDSCRLLSGCAQSIFDIQSGKSLDFMSGPIEIGNHVLICAGSTVIGGTEMSEGSILAPSSMAVGRCANNSLYSGSPAVLISKNIAWSKKKSGVLNDCSPYVTPTTEV